MSIVQDSHFFLRKTYVEVEHLEICISFKINLPHKKKQVELIEI